MTSQPPEAFDVVIIGAGISGVGAAYHLQQQCPDKSFVILEAQDDFGGTWLTHRYPGIRSDSDLYTFGYRFKPWTGPPIATAEEILKYLDEVIQENRIGEHIRYGHAVERASWSSDDARWTVAGTRRDTGDAVSVSGRFLWMCQGYYEHAQGYTPEWDGMDDFEGEIVHPQTWPEELDLSGKRVVVIGSGATAATLVPAIADDAQHVTMLQRSPTYFIPGVNQNEMADQLRELEVPEEWVHEITRRKILKDQAAVTQACVDQPEEMKKLLIEGVRQLLPEGFDVETHFTPRYRPWQQRIAFVPDGDIFAGIRAGKASVVTDEIDAFTKRGLRLKSGAELDADVVVTATGFNLSVLGNIAFSKDGEPVDFAKTVTYRGMMFTEVPNLLWVFGYFRASWTLRVDLLGDFVCRLLQHMDAVGARRVDVALRPEDEGCEPLPWMAEDNFNPNYLKRRMDRMPKRLDKPEWQHTQDYWREKEEIPAISLDAPEFRYS